MNAHPFPRAAAEPPDSPPPPCARAMQMGEAMREIGFRDGNVTEPALIAEGFTAAEIVEHADAARRYAGYVLARVGAACDRIDGVIGKAVAAHAGMMPLTGATAATEAMRAAWGAYCAASAAHRLDPWPGQVERTLARLKGFLGHLPMLERERNRVVTAVAASLKRRVHGAGAIGGTR